MLIETARELVDHKVRHVDVDFARELNEACTEIELLRLPREVEGVDGNAMATEAGARQEPREAEGLGLRRVNHLVDVDSHAHAELFEFVDERDVDTAIDVFE